MKKYLLFLVALVFVTSCEKESSINFQPEQGIYDNGSATLQGPALKIDVCHNGMIINISQNALLAHVAHGDAVDMDGDGYYDKASDCGSEVDCDDTTYDAENSCGPPTVTSATGRIWMDRNLGATQVATSSTDDASYGDLYQWGRGADGHQSRTSGTTTTQSSTDQPGHGDFIIQPSDDWRSPQNDNLWQGLSGVNNPCPSGYRLPTDAEWDAERLTWTSNNGVGAFDSPLKLTLAGLRFDIDGTFYGVGSLGYYWSSNVTGIYARSLEFDIALTNAGPNGTSRARGYSVRCIKD